MDDICRGLGECMRLAQDGTLCRNADICLSCDGENEPALEEPYEEEDLCSLCDDQMIDHDAIGRCPSHVTKGV